MQVAVEDLRLELGYRARAPQKLVVLVVNQALIGDYARLVLSTEMILLDPRLHIVLQFVVKTVLLVFSKPFDGDYVGGGACVGISCIIIRFLYL